MGIVIHKNLFIVCSIFLLWSVGNSSLGADRIEPTRLPAQDRMTAGKLAVFSEPPGLAVVLDGKPSGQTPVRIESIAPGTHELQIENKEKTIFVNPGQELRISFFKGSFIEIPASETTPSQQPEAKEPTPPQKQPTPPQPDESKLLEPGYFPLEPSGPIR